MSTFRVPLLFVKVTLYSNYEVVVNDIGASNCKSVSYIYI